ncbi:MAG: nucleoside-diphosphate kinase [bacterium]
MAAELAYVLIDPYTISKSRTGGVVGRYLARSDLDLVACRMFGPSQELIQRYSDLVRHADPADAATCNLLADYIRTSCGPDASGRPRRMMMLLFEGENAVDKVWRVTGSATLRWGSGESIRDTYGDYILNDDGAVRYFEPAVLVAPNAKRAAATLRLWCEYADTDGGVIKSAMDLAAGVPNETTLVLLKPDNFRYHSSRPGSIVDLLSSSGLRIIGAKKFRMTVSQAEEFYAPVKPVLRSKLMESTTRRSGEALVREFGFEIPDDVKAMLGERLSQLLMEREFENIVQFMTGHRPSECAGKDKTQVCGEECLALLYCGPSAVAKIRNLLGATDPAKAQPGSVRREYGSSIMVNAAHASDSPQNAVREMNIIDIQQDSIRPWVEKYYPK